MIEMPVARPTSTNDYAESLFYFERLHPRWIESCANYLQHIFGTNIQGKIFLDYAFGRGNWSLAALRAGAAGVVAIDAAESNVRRFSDYCAAQEIRRVDIIHGDVIDRMIERTVDVLWLYGILHHIAEPDLFLSRIVEMRRNDDSLALLYAYDRGSLRQVVVEAARQGIVYQNAQAFGRRLYSYSRRELVYVRATISQHQS